MTDFTRITVVGATRRADVVVATTEPWAGLLPRVVDLLGERGTDSAQPLALVRVTGDEIDLSGDSATQSVADGEVLHLVRRSDAPPPPEVSDVTDAVSEALTRRGDLWSPRVRRTVAAGVASAATFLAASVVVDAGSDPADRPATAAGLVAVAVVAAALSLVLGRTGRRWSASSLTAAGAGLALPLGVSVAQVAPAHAGPLAWTLAAAWAWLAVGAGLGLGSGHRPVVPAAGLGAGLALLASALWLTAVPVEAAWGVVAVVALLAAGLLPWYAMSTAGLTGLDDQTASGSLPARDRVVDTLADAYRSLDWATAAVAVPLGASATALVLSDDPWAVALGVVVALVTALRTRSFPLALQGVLLWAAVAVAVLVGLSSHLSGSAGVLVAALSAVAVVAVLTAGVQPAAHTRARLRSLGNVLETLSVITALPLLLGAFDLYSQLLGTF